MKLWPNETHSKIPELPLSVIDSPAFVMTLLSIYCNNISSVTREFLKYIDHTRTARV